jgi:uncharacterized membrane protein (UPF0182 family)
MYSHIVAMLRTMLSLLCSVFTAHIVCWACLCLLRYTSLLRYVLLYRLGYVLLTALHAFVFASLSLIISACAMHALEHVRCT